MRQKLHKTWRIVYKEYHTKKIIIYGLKCNTKNERIKLLLKEAE